jgi:hypothetical protein
MNTRNIKQARREELAVEKAIGGMDQEEWLQLLRQVGLPADAPEETELERAAAAIDLARQPRPEPMPRHLLAAVAADAGQYFATERAPAPALARAAPALPATSRRRGARSVWFTYGGWLAAAASLVAVVGPALLERDATPRSAPAVAATTQPGAQISEPAPSPAGSLAAATADNGSDATGRGRPRTPQLAVAPADTRFNSRSEVTEVVAEAAADPAAERAALVAQRFVLRRNWAPAGDSAGRAVQGDVVWDARTQTGYMRFVGLRRNDPSSEQYQLWIFDGRRDERYPVDGGVFDVRGGEDEVIVPIRARLPVGTPLAFAVTIERPGGVVVSERNRVVVIARVG